MLRRDLLLSVMAGAAAAATPAGATATRREGRISPSGARWDHLRWARGIEGQRRSDLGNGRFLNPVFSGDRPDPALIRVDDVWYLTFSSFDAYPGLTIWKSLDLVNWSVVTAALRQPIGSVWAPALAICKGRYFLYIPARTPQYRSIYVIHADRIEGPWSDPIDLRLNAHIDPEHVEDLDGTRWLFLSGGDRIRLSDDGLSTIGAVEHVYDPWRYPEDWVVESFSPEGPKIVRRGEYWYMITAVGGTAGPPTGHMVIVARARALKGPWEDCPANPIVRTWSADEKWWSRGHATLFEVPGRSWWMAYHGYENGFWTLGRQMLLDPVTWSRDGWPVARGGDLSRSLPKPIPGPVTPHGQALSDDFTTDRMGTLWSIYDPGPAEAARLSRGPDGLRIAAKGTSPGDCSPLTFICGDLTYEVEAEITLEPGAEAGLLLFYSKRLYAGLGFNAGGLIMHRYGRQRRARGPSGALSRLFIRILNDRNIVTIHFSLDGTSWTKHSVQMEVSGYNHNVDGDFLSLRPALYVSGQNGAVFKSVTYRAL
jgi:xylan 1,4-beta-xylosidase